MAKLVTVSSSRFRLYTRNPFGSDSDPICYNLLALQDIQRLLLCALLYQNIKLAGSWRENPFSFLHTSTSQGNKSKLVRSQSASRVSFTQHGQEQRFIIQNSATKSTTCYQSCALTDTLRTRWLTIKESQYRLQGASRRFRRFALNNDHLTPVQQTVS